MGFDLKESWVSWKPLLSPSMLFISIKQSVGWSIDQFVGQLVQGRASVMKARVSVKLVTPPAKNKNLKFVSLESNKWVFVPAVQHGSSSYNKQCLVLAVYRQQHSVMIQEEHF